MKKIGIVLAFLIAALPLALAFDATGAQANSKIRFKPYVCPFSALSDMKDSEKLLDFMLEESAGLTATQIFEQNSCENLDGGDIFTCEDTDGGIMPFEQGTVSGTIDVLGNIYEYSFTDFCSPCTEDLLVEFYCDDGNCGETPQYSVITCEFGCDDGACRDNDIPEFGFAAGLIAVLGALGGFLVLRKRK